MAKKSILLVDDCKEIMALQAEFIAAQFGHNNVDMCTQPDSESALRFLEKKAGAIDLVITDIYRPGMDGYAFIREVKAKYHRIPIIVCSGNAQQKDLEVMLENNLIERYVRKPFAFSDFVGAVKDVTGLDYSLDLIIKKSNIVLSVE